MLAILADFSRLLLELPQAFNGTVPLERTAQNVNGSDDLQAIGYPLGIIKMSNTTVRLRFGGTKLRDIVPQSVVKELSASGSPSPEIAITDIQGNLLPDLMRCRPAKGQG